MGANAQWKPVGDKIKQMGGTDKSSHCIAGISSSCAERAEWKNLNGEWAYAIREKEALNLLRSTELSWFLLLLNLLFSGVQKTVGEKNELWYKRTFTVPASLEKEKTGNA